MIEILSQKIIEQFKLITGIQCRYDLFERGKEPHFTTLSKEEQGVYVFYRDDVCFKVGKAGSKSQARWNSHHYNLDVGTKSSMTKSITNDLSFFKSFFNNRILLAEIDELESNNIKEWIKQNISRIEFKIPGKESKFALSLLESLIQFYFRPAYEGKVKMTTSMKFK